MEWSKRDFFRREREDEEFFSPQVERRKMVDRTVLFLVVFGLLAYFLGTSFENSLCVRVDSKKGTISLFYWGLLPVPLKTAVVLNPGWDDFYKIKPSGTFCGALKSFRDTYHPTKRWATCFRE